jgi:hypothetical protein
MSNIYQVDPELPYIPYTYIIGWKSLKVYYFGSESGIVTKTANPANLWNTYFTSSDLVSQFRFEHGEPDIICVVRTYTSAGEARAAEAAYLTRINAADRSNWLNQHNGTGKFHTSGLKMVTNGKETKCIDPNKGVPEGWWYGVDDKARERKRLASLKREAHFPPYAYERYKEVRASSQLCNNGLVHKLIPKNQPIPPGWVKGQTLQKTEATRRAQIGKTKTASTKAKISDQHSGDKWFNNGLIEIHTKECPDGWQYGRLPITDQSRKNRSKAQQGRGWFTNGFESKKFRRHSQIPDGWYPGRVVGQSTKPRKRRSTKWFWITDGSVDKQHVVDLPIPEGFSKGKCKNYKGPKKRKEDPTVYKLYHPKHGEVSGTRSYFEEQWGISKGKFSRLRRVTKNKPYGWRMVR